MQNTPTLNTGYFQPVREEEQTEEVRPPSPFLIIADKMVSGPVILNVGGKK